MSFLVIYAYIGSNLTSHALQVTGVYGEIFCENSHPLPTVLGGSFVVTEKFLQVQTFLSVGIVLLTDIH